MRILISGGAGFVGSNLALRLKETYRDYQIICLDNLKRRGSELNLGDFRGQGIDFHHGDIRNWEDLEALPPFDVLVDASAEPSVLAGIGSSVKGVVNTNLMGTVNLLELARQHNAGFIFLSTSRVYPIEAIESANWTEKSTRFEWLDQQEMLGISSKGISAEFTLKGARSFYGSTKLASELFIQEYQAHTGLKTVINRCGVISGPRQMGKVDQGFVTLWVARHFWPKSLGYFGYGGEGKQVRDILHIEDLFQLVKQEIHQLDDISGEVFNVGGGNRSSLSLCELTDLCRKVSGNTIEIQRVTENRAADLRIYITDNSHVTNRLGWSPQIEPSQLVEDIWHWLTREQKSLKSILS